MPLSVAPLAASTRTLFRLYSFDSSGDKPKPVAESSSLAELENKKPQFVYYVVQELKEMIDKYFKGDEKVLPAVIESILRRRILRKHEETDDKLMEELRMKPLNNVND